MLLGALLWGRARDVAEPLREGALGAFTAEARWLAVDPDVELRADLTRRALLRDASLGLGGLALGGLLGREASAQEALPALPHFAPKAKRVIYLFQNGAPSHVDLFDWKPILRQRHGEPIPDSVAGGKRFSTMTGDPSGKLMLEPVEPFAQHGKSGAWVSEFMPHTAKVVDDLCFIKSLHGSNPAHGAALLKIHTGSENFVRPSMGSWITYGLGSENRDLPGFVTICPTLGHGGVNNYSSAFLPAAYHGTAIGHAGVKAYEAKCTQQLDDVAAQAVPSKGGKAVVVKRWW